MNRLDLQMKLRQFARRSNGFGLLEVLIALLIISIGFLGVAGLNASYVMAQDALNRQTAANIALDLSNRIKMNRVNAAAGGSFYVNPGTQGSMNTDCRTANCNPSQLAQFDVFQAQTQAQANLPNGKLSVCLTTAGTGGGICTNPAAGINCNFGTLTGNVLPSIPANQTWGCTSTGNSTYYVYVISVTWTGINGTTERYISSVTP